MNPVQELHNFLKKVIIEAIETCRGQGLLSYNQLPDFVIEVPREKGHGDFPAISLCYWPGRLGWHRVKLQKLL